VLYALLKDTTRLHECGGTIKKRWIQHEKLLDVIEVLPNYCQIMVAERKGVDRLII
jgi:hypothetical protein